MTRKDVLNKLRDMGIAPIAQSVLSDFTEIANWAAAAERERCAKVCCTLERMRLDVFRNGGRLAEISPADCAVAIRGMK